MRELFLELILPFRGKLVIGILLFLVIYWFYWILTRWCCNIDHKWDVDWSYELNKREKPVDDPYIKYEHKPAELEEMRQKYNKN